MNILMTNADLNEIGGTQTWTETMAREFVRRGHSVSFLSPRVGSFYHKHLSGLGPVAESVKADLAIVNHPICFPNIKALSGAFAVFNAHGPTHRLEMMLPGADHYVCVSEEVARNNAMFNPDIVRNPIDLDLFRPRATVSDTPRVFINTKNETALQMTKEACEQAGLDFGFAHYKENPVDRIDEQLPKYDICVTSGRGAYEAMACGLSVIVFSYRLGGVGVKADGWVTPDNIKDIVSVNCSGRFYGHAWDVDELTQALKEYAPTSLRGWVEEHHDVKKTAEYYLNLVRYEQAA